LALAGVFFPAFFAVAFGVGFLADRADFPAAFFAAGLPAGPFLAAAFFAIGFLAAAFFATGLFAAAF
jgi:hypothetical protein